MRARRNDAVERRKTLYPLTCRRYQVSGFVEREVARPGVGSCARRISYDEEASITKARRLGTPDARMMFHEGAIRVAAGETARGKKLIADALKKNPAFDVSSAREAKAMLDERMAIAQ